MTGKNFTVSCWVYLRAVNSLEIVSKMAAAAKKGWGFYLFGPDDLRFYVWDYANDYVQLGRRPYLNQWEHFVGVSNSTHTAIYANGSFIASVAKGAGSHAETVNNPLWIAAQSGDDDGSPDNYFNGSVDDVLIFDRALTEDEIKALYNASTYQYEHNFTGLSDGHYLFTGYDPDKYGNKNQTEERNVTIDTIKPSVQFIDPTPYNDTHKNDTWIYVNLSSSDANQHYAFVDFNYDVVLWMRMDDTTESYYLNEDDTEDSAYYTGVWSGTAGGAYDENWGTFMAAEEEGAIYINYTIPANVSSVINEIKYSNADDEEIDLHVYGYNSSSSQYEFIVALETGNQNYTNVTIPSCCLGDTGDTLYMKYLANGGGGQPVFYEEKMKWNITDVTVNDLSSYGNNGTAMDASQTDNGYFGKTFEFDGDGDYINISDSASQSITDNITFSVWVKLDDNYTYNPILRKGESLGTDINEDGIVNTTDQDILLAHYGESGYSEPYPRYDVHPPPYGNGSVELADNGAVLADIGKTNPPLWYLQISDLDDVGTSYCYFYLNGTTTPRLKSSTTFNSSDVGTWYHIVAVYNGSYSLLYINGTLDASQANSGTIDLVNSPLYVGADNYRYHWNGTIDELMIYNRSLDSTEIKALYNASTYQYEHNFTGLSDGYYLFTGYDPDRAGNRNETEERNVTIDTTKPSVEFISPTPSNGTQPEDYIYVNVSSSDENQHYTFTDFDNDLVLWMRMDDINATGDPQDLSSYGNDGIKKNSANQTDNGYFGKAFEFDGSAGSIEIDSDSSINFDKNSNYTFNFWVYVNEQTTNDIYQDGVPTGGGIRLYLDSTANNMSVMDLTIPDFSVSSTSVSLNEWHMLTFVYNGTNDWELYLDGSFSEVLTRNIASSSGATHKYIAGQDFEALYFNGSIDETLIFNRNLSVAEIQSLYNASTYQYEHNFTGLSLENYTFTSYAVDRAGNRNQTETRYRNISNTPVVVTNASTGVEEYNATINGYLQFDGGESCTVRFEYGLTTSYGTNTTNQTKSTGDEFSASIPSDNEKTLYERYNKDDNTGWTFYGNEWRAQTFTIGTTSKNENHYIASVKLLLYKGGNPGTVTVSIRASSGGIPTGDDLTSGTTDGNTLPAASPGEWREINLTPFQLQASTTYAIVIRAPDGDNLNYVVWRCDNNEPTYTGGVSSKSSDSGKDWAEDTGVDLMFEEYGTIIGILSPGTLYHYRAYANNTAGSDTGDDMAFLTKPLHPSGFAATV